VRRRYNYRRRAPSPSCRDIKTHPFPPEASLPSLPPITPTPPLPPSLTPSPLPRVSFCFFSRALAGSRVEFRDRRERSNDTIRYRAFFRDKVERSVCEEVLSTVDRSIDRDRRSDLHAPRVNILSSEIYAPKNGVVIARGWERAWFLSRDEISSWLPPSSPPSRRRRPRSSHAPPHVSRHVAPPISDAAHVFR